MAGRVFLFFIFIKYQIKLFIEINLIGSWRDGFALRSTDLRPDLAALGRFPRPKQVLYLYRLV